MYTLKQLAEHVGGVVAGDAETPVRGIAPFEQAGPGDITLAAEKRYLAGIADSPAAAVLVPADSEAQEGTQLRVADPKLAFVQLMHLFFDKPFEAEGIADGALVGEDCRISERVTIRAGASIGARVHIEDEVWIGAGAVIGDDCRIGQGSTLHPNCTLYSGVQLGRGVIIHGGTVIGADGFGYVFDGERQLKVPQTGSVRLEDDVEIGANSCVDRATFGETVIGRGAKLDNHVHVGHNCRIGENTVIVGQVGISGSVTIGRNCVLAGQAGVIDHIHIGDDVTVMVKTAVTRDLPSGSVISGQPSRDHRENLQIQAIMRRLPDIYALFRELQREGAGAAERPGGHSAATGKRPQADE